MSADLPTGGVRINFIPRDGGNTFADATFFTFTTAISQSNNFTRRAESRRTAGAERDQEELGPQRSPFGRADHGATRSGTGSHCDYNGVRTMRRSSRTRTPTIRPEFLYVPDTASEGSSKGRSYNSSLPVHVAGDAAQQDRRHLQSRHMVPTVPTRSHARSSRLRRPRLPLPAVASDARGVDLAGDQTDAAGGCGHAPLRAMGPDAPARRAARSRLRSSTELAPQMISVTEQSTALVYRAPALRQQQHPVPNFAYRAGAMAVCHRLAQSQGGLQPRPRLPGDDDLQPEPISPTGSTTGCRTSSRCGPTRSRSGTTWTTTSGIFAPGSLEVSNRATLGLALRYDYFRQAFPSRSSAPPTLRTEPQLRIPRAGQLGLE